VLNERDHMEQLEKEKYMRRAIELALKGEGFVNPNPLVGAVIVKDSRIIGEGYHQRYGEPHAEVNAFKNATEDVNGSTIFVTLEPCSHFGKQPPCAAAIIEKGIKKVVIGLLDPNPLVSGKGIKMLEEAGIEVEVNFLADEIRRVNEIFLKYITTRRPFVAMKYAMTLDGKLATKDFDSKWITNEDARKHVHKLRNRYASILVGVNTIIKDDAKLNVRLDYETYQPIRIVIDPELNIPLKSYVVKTAKQQQTWVVSKKYDETLENLGVRIIQMDEINLEELLNILGKEGIDSVFIEGGAYTHGTFLDQGLVDKVYAYIAPKLIGGKNALTPVSGEGVSLMKDAFELEDIKFQFFGDNILVEGLVKKEKL